MLVNAALARKLGVSNFGAIYLAGTVLTLAFLLVDWGAQGQVAAEIARHPGSAPRIFGTGLALRLSLAAAVLIALRPFASLMGYDATVRTALALLGFRYAVASVGSLCNAVLRGFERIGWQARATVLGAVFEAVLVIAALLRGGGLQGALTAQVVAVSITLCVQLLLVARLGMGRPSLDGAAARVLLGGGFTFLLLELVLKLQPYIDAAFLSRLAAPEALGWYSAASRITGVLIFPALTLQTALYPTLARLWKHDRPSYEALMRIGLRAVIILGVLAATGTIIFSPLIVRLVYGAAAYGPAATNLAVLSPFMLLVYGSLVLGSGINACARQLRWALAQSFCLVVSVALDPLLIPWAQARYGNGSLGVCISVVVAEVAMVNAGVAILPVQVRGTSLGRTLRCSLLAGAAMGLVGYLLRGLPALAIPATTIAYVAVLWLQGEIDSDLVSTLRSVVFSRLGGERSAAKASPSASIAT
jgi:O-antigen/teichoic acid export membrane protein